MPETKEKIPKGTPNTEKLASAPQKQAFLNLYVKEKVQEFVDKNGEQAYEQLTDDEFTVLMNDHAKDELGVTNIDDFVGQEITEEKLNQLGNILI